MLKLTQIDIENFSRNKKWKIYESIHKLCLEFQDGEREIRSFLEAVVHTTRV